MLFGLKKTDQSVYIAMPKISQAKRDARQQQILDAALACFSENGFHQTGMADIVRRSGLSHGAVYLYFQSKDDLIEALAVDRHRQEALLNEAARHVDDPLEGLRVLVRGYTHWLTDPSSDATRRVGVNGWAEALRNERVRTSVIEGLEAARAVIVVLIERAQSKRLVSGDLSADAVARTLVALFQGFLLQFVWRQPIDVDAALAVVDRMLGGLVPPAPTATPRKKRAS
jgi:AcrR family transcriptional regulator